MSACIKLPSPGPKASAPLAPVTGQSYQKIFADGSSLGDASNWSCVKDKKTGLVWERKRPDEANVLRQSDNAYTWYSDDAGYSAGVAGSMADMSSCDNTLSTCDTQSYVDAVNLVGLCGNSDWRLPTREELISLVDRESGINSEFFDHAVTTPHWAANTNAATTSAAWTVDFDTGGEAVSSDDKSGAHAVRLVRGAWAATSANTCEGTLYQAKADNIYAVAASSDGVDLPSSAAFIDKQTGLMWKNAEESAADWDASMLAAGSATDFGYTNWRLPTITEVYSLLDVGCNAPSSNANYFTSANMLWTATENAMLVDAYLMDFSVSQEAIAMKSVVHSYLLVRTAY